MRIRGLFLVGILSAFGWAGCGGSAECGPGTLEQDGVCVPEDPGGIGGDGDADDLGGQDDPADPADPGPGDDLDPGPADDGDPVPGDDVPPGDDMPGDPPPEDPADPAAGCDAGGDCSGLAHEIFDAINAARAAAGEGSCAGSAFAWDDGVASVALGHATVQAAAGQIAVEDPAGTLGDRMDAAGVSWSAIGEVYGRAHGTAAEVVEAWMGSDRLRAYLVSCEYSLGGVGAAVGPSGGAAFVTGTFAAP